MARLGVLALQGAFTRHAAMLSELGHEPVLVRAARELCGLEGLVLPGGESSVQLELAVRLGLADPLRAFAGSGRPVFATCAGLILLARAVTPAQASFGLLDVAVRRNAWGRQLDSFEARADRPSDEPAWHAPPLIFIRAPRITEVGPAVQVLACYRSEPVLVRERNITAATFHPELTGDPTVHAYVFGRA